MHRTILAIAAAGTLAACAQSPNSIAPVSMSGAFNSVDCQTAVTERNATQSELAALSSAQQGAVVGDAVGVLLIGVPMASLTGGDRAGEIAAAKGKLNALDARLVSCGA